MPPDCYPGLLESYLGIDFEETEPRKRTDVPIYDFTCAEGHEFESRVPLTTSPAPPCPVEVPQCDGVSVCGANSVQNDISFPSRHGDHESANHSSVRFHFNYEE